MNKFSHVLQPLALTATTVVASSLALLQSVPAQAANLVTNGDFETGNLTGWTANGSFLGVDNPGTNGTKTAYMGTTGSLGSLSQILTTVVGETYTLSYDFFSEGSTPNQFQVQVNGSILFDQIDIPAQAFTPYSFNFVGTGSDTIQFNERNDPSFLQLDNVVVDVVAVPEPFTIVGSLIGGTAALRMRKKLKSSNKP
jgi:Carbohydrate binding domain